MNAKKIPTQQQTKPGRRPGNEDTRATIIAAATEFFASIGYESTTIRKVATAAGVDPALVMHYFKNKEGLFNAVLNQMPDFTEQLSTITDARSLVDAYLHLWTDPDISPTMLAIVRAGIGSAKATQLLKDLLNFRFEERGLHITEGIQTRLPFAAAELFGSCIARYIVGVPRLAQLSDAEFAEAITPSIAATLQQN